MSRSFSVVRTIIHKRGGGEHPPGEIEELIERFVAGQVTDYQMAAWMMAVLFRGMTREETTRLTRAMIGSGRTLPKWEADGPIVDKHSTGGVGDKVSLVVAPLAAACGLRVPMISGRSLGHTGGTLDKLESIPGYRTDLPVDRFREIVKRVGVSIAGATEDLVPADRRMYALRDVAGIVESPPLIVASILSKKAAARLDGLVLDVKVGPGGFMPSLRPARRLAEMLCQASFDLGMRSEALLTDMTQPLGTTVGNALEVIESIEMLKGRPQSVAFRDICLAVTRSMLRVAGSHDAEAASRKVESAWRSGDGLECFGRMIGAHGGDRRVVERTALLPKAPGVRAVLAESEGWITAVDPREMGELVIDLGGGRRRADDSIDPRVGIVLMAKIGDRVAIGHPLATIHHTGHDEIETIARRLRNSFRLSVRRPRRKPIILARVGVENGRAG